MTVVFTFRARRDLAHIQHHISKDSRRAALRMSAKLIAACDGLESFPLRGRVGDEPGTRELTTVRPYIIVYRIRDSVIEIASIWHGRQNRG